METRNVIKVIMSENALINTLLSNFIMKKNNNNEKKNNNNIYIYIYTRGGHRLIFLI